MVKILLQVCNQLRQGQVVGIFGPQTDSIAEHVKSITDMVEIPFIDTRSVVPFCIVNLNMAKIEGKF